MSDYPIILDISRWQGEFDAVKAKAAGAVGVIIRATSGDYYTDPMFKANFARAKDAGLLAGAYHVFIPTSSAVRQIQRFIDTIGALEVDIPHTMDVEVASGQSPYTITTNLKACMQYVPRVRGKLPSIYTRKYWWDFNIIANSDWQIYPLHVAHYTTGPLPLLPRDWVRWALWQFSADGNGLGATYGVESANVDINRFNGDYAALRAFCGLADAPFPPVPAPPEPVYPRIGRVVSPVTQRAAASTASASYGLIPSGIEIRVHGTKTVGADEWAWLNAGQSFWCAVVYRGKRYLEWVDA